MFFLQSKLTNNYDAMMNLHNRWLTDMNQMKHENNQTDAVSPILSESFNKTLPEFEKALAAVTECAIPKPKGDKTTAAPNQNSPDPADQITDPVTPAPDAPAPDAPAPDAPAPDAPADPAA